MGQKIPITGTLGTRYTQMFCPKSNSFAFGLELNGSILKEAKSLVDSPTFYIHVKTSFYFISDLSRENFLSVGTLHRLDDPTQFQSIDPFQK